MKIYTSFFFRFCILSNFQETMKVLLATFLCISRSNLPDQVEFALFTNILHDWAQTVFEYSSNIELL